MNCPCQIQSYKKTRSRVKLSDVSLCLSLGNNLIVFYWFLIVQGSILLQQFNIKIGISLVKQRDYMRYNIQTVFCLCQTFKSFESLICSITNRFSTSLFGKEFERINAAVQVQSVHMNVYSVLFFWLLLNLCVWTMNTQHQGDHFYLILRTSKSKELGVHNHSALVMWNIIEREREESLSEDRETWWRETERFSMCLGKRATEHNGGLSKGVG